jgi:hypothetical protein
MTGQTVILSGQHQRDLAKRLIDKAPPCAVLNIREATRTIAQNDKMRSMLSDIARARPMGRVHPTEVWKCIFMETCGFKPSWVLSLDGDSVINTGYRSSRLGKSQMSDMIEAMYAYGAENGVQWSEISNERERVAA